MAVPKSPITDAELRLLKILWTRSPCTAKELAGELYEQVNPSSIGTVQKLIARLETKGFLRRDRTETPHRFSTDVTREDVAGIQLDDYARRLSEGSLSPFVLHLVKAKRLSTQEKEEIRRLLSEQ